MKRSWQLSLMFGILAFVFTFIFSIANNTWLPALFSAILGLLIFTGLGWLLQIIWVSFVKEPEESVLNPEMSESSGDGNEETEQNPEIGLKVETRRNLEPAHSAEPIKEPPTADGPETFKSIPLERLQKVKTNK